MNHRQQRNELAAANSRQTRACTGREPLLYCAPRFSPHRVAVHAGEAETLDGSMATEGSSAKINDVHVQRSVDGHRDSAGDPRAQAICRFQVPGMF